jgi:hypothetical protein
MLQDLQNYQVILSNPENPVQTKLQDLWRRAFLNV